MATTKDNMGDIVLKYDDLIKLSNAITELGYDHSNITVNIGIRTKERLNRLNDDFFYRSNLPEEQRIKDVSEININIGGITYHYYVIEELKTDENGN